MKTKRSRIVLSSVSVLLVLSLLAGMTMAWFTDTEKVSGNFAAGVLDVEVKPGDSPADGPMTFENLRPLTLDQFKDELNEVKDSDDQNNNKNTTGFAEKQIPVYFKPVTVTNTGTLPAKIQISMKDLGGQEHPIKNMVENGDGGVKVDEDNPTVLCKDAYTLKDVLKIFVYEETDEGWARVTDVNLNEAYDAAKANPDKKVTDESAKEAKDVYTLDGILAAGASEAFVIAGYLPSTVGNAYQAKHFHGSLVVGAGQTDDGASIGGSGSGSETPDPDKHEVVIKFHDKATGAEVGEERYTLADGEYTFSAGGTRSAQIIEVSAPEGYEYDPDAQKKTVTIKDGKLSEDVVFTVVRTDKVVTVKYNNTKGTADTSDDEMLAETQTVALKTPGEYYIAAANAPQQEDKTRVDVPAIPMEGYVFDTDAQSADVTVGEKDVTPAEVTFNVKPEAAPPVETDVSIVLHDIFNAEYKTITWKLTGTTTIDKDNAELIKLLADNQYVLYPDTQNQTVTVTGNTVEPKSVTFHVYKKIENNIAITTATGVDNIRRGLNGTDGLGNDGDGLNGKYIFANSVTMNSPFKPIGWVGDDDQTFTGIIDGNDKSINGLVIEGGTTSENVGFVAINQGTIQKLTFKSSEVDGSNYVGTIVGSNQGMVSNCHVIGGDVVGSGTYTNGKQIGGIVGRNGSSATVTCSSSSAYIKGLKYVGGLVGANFGTVDQCYATGSINTALSDRELMGNAIKYLSSNRYFLYSQIGGLVGENSTTGIIKNSYAVGGSMKAFEYVGGICGTNYGSIINALGAPNTIYYPKNYSLDGFTTYTAEDVHPSVGTNYAPNGSVGTLSGVYCVSMNNLPSSSEGNRGAIVRNRMDLEKANTYTGWDTNVWNLQNGSYPDLVNNAR